VSLNSEQEFNISFRIFLIIVFTLSDTSPIDAFEKLSDVERDWSSHVLYLLNICAG
jgi:hypothetical protein